MLAFITTLHLALTVLRAHRPGSPGWLSFVTSISLLFAASPWLLGTPAGLAAGVACHLAWFVACERLIRLAPPARAGAPLAAPVSVVPPPRRNRDFVQVPVLAVIDETPDIRTFRFARPERFAFKAGQFLTVRVRADGRDHVRCYSISSSPTASGYLEISVKRHGLVSGTLHATLRPGSLAWIKPPAGAFLYPADEDRALVMLAGGVGITPLMSMLRFAVHADPSRPVTLLYSVRSEDDIAFRDELRVLAARHAQLKLVIAITGAPAGGAYFPGRLNDTLIHTAVPDLAHAVSLICGSPAMTAAMKSLLAEAGVPAPQIRCEVFEAAIAASAGLPASAPAAAGAHYIRFTRSGRTHQVAAGQTLLEAAEACGADIPSLCRAGVCGTCRTRVVDGDADCSSAMLDEEDRREGYVLACSTRVRTNCTVDA